MRTIKKNLDMIAWLLALLAYTLGLKFVLGIHPHPIEIASILLIIPSLILVRKQSVWGLALNALASVLLVIYFVSIGLYGQVALRTFITLNCFVSIYFWLRGGGAGKKRSELKPSFLRGWQRALILVGLAAVVAVALPGGLIRVFDYASMYVVITGSLLIIKKKTESWGLFLVGDAAGMPLFILSAAYMNIFFTAFTSINNAMGFCQWRKARGK